MNPLKPEKGEKYIGPESGTIYEWDREKWVVIAVKDTPVNER
jgi:hypothetical protein